jgi:predicted phosphodiesterase
MDLEKRKKLVSEYTKEHTGLSNTDIARKLIQNFPNELSIENIENLRKAVQCVRKRLLEPEESITIPTKEEKKWQVVAGNYTWKSANGLINIPVEQIDNLFYEYSEHGLNLSQTEIINKHNLQVWEWNSIKNTLWLFKKSNIFSPHTVENTAPDELDEMISSKIRKMFDNTGYQVEKQYNKELNKKYKKVIKDQTIQDVTLKAMVLEIADKLPEALVQPFVRIKKDAEGVINLFLFDIHYGAQNRTDYTPKYSPEIIKEQLIHISEIVNKYDAKEVNIFFGGDMIEDFTNKMHVDSHKGIARGYFGAKLIIELYKLLVEFISQINNVKSVFAVPGNHDRATEKREMDSEGSMAEILFELIRISFGEKVRVKYDEKLISEKIDGINYIMTHGHFRLTDVTPAELVLRFGDAGAFNLLVSGHFHERKVKKDHEMFRQIVCPSLFTGNDYSFNLGFTASPGFILVKNNEYSNKPIVLDYTL